MWPLEYFVVVELDYVSSILDRLLYVLIQIVVYPEHEDEWGLNTVQQDLRQERCVDKFEFKWEDQGFDSFTAIHELDRVVAREEVTCVQQHALKQQ